MTKRFLKYFDFDWILMSAIIFLLAFGLITIYSLSLSGSTEGTDFFVKQLVFIGISFFFFFFFSFIDYRIWKSYTGFFYLLGIILLIAVLLWGKTIRGTSGWFDLGFFNFQPVELMKLFLILSLASYFSKKIGTVKMGLKETLVSFVYTLIPVLLVMRQPDFGSAVTMLIIWFGILFLANVPRKFLAVIVVGALFVILLGWNVFLKDYQKQRLQVFLNPQSDPMASGYNVIQSTVAVGSGQLKGKGFGHGSQSQLNFLPERHTDFIYAAFAEESGLIGASVMLGLFAVVFYRLVKIFSLARDSFGQLIIGGIIIMLAFHVFVNIGMNIGLMPVVGLSLPYVSYGGSFLIASMACLGLVQNIWRRRNKEKFQYIEE